MPLSDIEFSDATLESDVEQAIKNLPLAHLEFAQLDSMLKGIRKNDFILFAGGPGTSKTTTVSMIADSLAAAGHPVLFASYEMKNFQLVAKSLARLSEGKLKESDIAGCKANSPQSEHLREITEQYRAIARNIVRRDDRPNIERLKTTLREIKRFRHQTPVFICDYCQIVKFANDEDCNDVASRASIVADKLLAIALDLDVPVIATSAVSRGTYTKDKVGADCLSGTMKLEYNATAVIRLTSDNTSDQQPGLANGNGNPHRRIKATILKNRWGELGQVDFDFYPEFALLKEANLG